ncbi:MAG: methionine biosynthesis protein MetW [Nocardioides sp.]|nr:methionine biosynthesis protein MetW [Nocardioides sp.]
MRPDLAIVADLIPAHARVLDLGCGGGKLLAHLAERGCTVQGVEIDDDSVLRAIRRGVPVIEGDLESELSTFADDSYDVVVLSQTLQAMVHPAQVLREMRRVGGQGIVSVPNFGLWRNRLALLRGRMPVSRTIPHPWHETPNIHHSTLADLEALLGEVEMRVVRRILLDEHAAPLRSAVLPNLRAAAAIYLVR